jgi:hypothetical protein
MKTTTSRFPGEQSFSIQKSPIHTDIFDINMDWGIEFYAL